MKDDAFEWDDAKAAANQHKHGVSFEMARDLFNDAFAIEWADNTNGEARFLTVGMVENTLILAVYTMRGDRIRIISARMAEPFERRRYHHENQT